MGRARVLVRPLSLKEGPEGHDQDPRLRDPLAWAQLRVLILVSDVTLSNLLHLTLQFPCLSKEADVARSSQGRED